ncbi:MAG: hypothetical protein Tsb0010_00680 [Parvularculaceae bacterium]
MSIEIYQEPEAGGPILRAFRRIPLLLRAVVIGFFVMQFGVTVWQLLARTNVMTTPALPWSSAAALAFLFAYWKYFGGAGWPRATAETRRLSLRAHPIAPRAGAWVWIAALAGLAFTLALHFLSLRFVNLPPEALSLLPRGLDIPPHTLWISMVMVAVVAGVCEEAGIRGYLQTPLESRYGVIPAILASSIVFTLMHFNRELGVAFAIPIFISAIWYGALTAAANSIIPMVFVHIALDLALLGYHDVLNGPIPAPFAETGADVSMQINAAVAGVAGVVLIVSIWRAARLTRR